jgi:hypothetical protein
VAETAPRNLPAGWRSPVSWRRYLLNTPDFLRFGLNRTEGGAFNDR